MKRIYIIPILLSSALVSILFVFTMDTQKHSSENFTDCEKKIYSIESQIKKAVGMNQEHKVKGLEIALKRVNAQCRTIL